MRFNSNWTEKYTVLLTISKQEERPGLQKSAITVSVKPTYNMLVVYKNILLFKLFRNRVITPLFYHRIKIKNKFLAHYLIQDFML